MWPGCVTAAGPLPILTEFPIIACSPIMQVQTTGCIFFTILTITSLLIIYLLKSLKLTYSPSRDDEMDIIPKNHKKMLPYGHLKIFINRCLF
jgi:hypothetical protein